VVRRPRRTGFTVLKILFGALAVLIGLWSIVPFLLQILSSLQPDAVLNSGQPALFSQGISLDHYLNIFNGTDQFQLYIRNSVIIAVASTLVALAFAIASAYALTRLPLPGKAAVLGVTLGLSMFPQIAIVAPLYLIMSKSGLLNTYGGLGSVYVGMSVPLMIFILYVHFRTIPYDLDEAASIDGAGRIKTLFSILLPLMGPGIVTAALLGFIANWSEFLFALSFTSDPQHQTVPVGIANFQVHFFVPWGDMAAASVVVTIPLVVLALVFQRRLVSGITAGGVKE
jgi:ABC-type glycerol-3-phosphate transport system permease component